MTEEMKLKMFEAMLKMEREVEKDISAMERANGAFAIIKELGLSNEYIIWSFGKDNSKDDETWNA